MAAVTASEPRRARWRWSEETSSYSPQMDITKVTKYNYWLYICAKKSRSIAAFSANDCRCRKRQSVPVLDIARDTRRSAPVRGRPELRPEQDQRGAVGDVAATRGSVRKRRVVDALLRRATRSPRPRPAGPRGLPPAISESRDALGLAHAHVDRACVGREDAVRPWHRTRDRRPRAAWRTPRCARCRAG